MKDREYTKLKDKVEKTENSAKSDRSSSFSKTRLRDRIQAKDFEKRGPDPLTVKGTDAADFLNQLEERKKTAAWLRESRDKIYRPLVEKASERYQKVNQLVKEKPNILGGEEF